MFGKIIIAASLILLLAWGALLYLQSNKKIPVASTPTQVIQTSSPSPAATPTLKPSSSPKPVIKTSTGPNTINVLSIAYFPKDSSGENLNEEITKYARSISGIHDKVSSINQQLVQNLSNGTKYHGYKNPAATPSITYNIVESKEFLEALPPSTFGSPVQPDYKSILNRVNICDYVDNKSVRQVWLWGYHTDKIAPIESDMSMGLDSKSFWNHGSYGDVSNSYQIDDLPVCHKTYVLYNYNYQRTVAEAVHDHMHQLENIFGFADASLWAQFVSHCGDTHHPVNSSKDYDYQNSTQVLSNCADWKPDGSGATAQVDCHSWSGSSCIDDGGLSWYVWWMQNIPGKDNNLIYQGKPLRNWWELYLDFDKGFSAGKSLIKS